MKNREIFSFADCFTSSADLIVVHSSLSDFAPGLARDEEFPLFPPKLGVVTRFRKSRTGYVATVETEWPTLTSTTRGELALCPEAEQMTREQTKLLIERCESLSQELVNQADRLRSSLKPKELIHASKVNPADYATLLDDSGKSRSWEISACDRRESEIDTERRERRARELSRSLKSDNVSKPSSSRSPQLDASALSAILAEDD